jgi:hypothetical protein
LAAPLPQRKPDSPEETAELTRLFNILPMAITQAKDLLWQSSPRDPDYLTADAEVSEILARIAELTMKPQ